MYHAVWETRNTRELTRVPKNGYVGALYTYLYIYLSRVFTDGLDMSVAYHSVPSTWKERVAAH